MGRFAEDNARRPDSLVPQALTDDPVERAVAEIRHVSRATALDLALNIGEIVFHRIFRGDAMAVRLRGPKDVSFRRLTAHPELPVSAATLWRSVAIYEISLRLPQLIRSRSLGVSHLRAVLGLEPAEQDHLLLQANANGWSVSRLAEQVAQQRRKRGGRRKTPPLLRALQALQALAELPYGWFGDRATLRELLSDDEKLTLRETVKSARQRIRKLERALGKRSPSRKPGVSSWKHRP